MQEHVQSLREEITQGDTFHPNPGILVSLHAKTNLKLACNFLHNPR